MKNIRNLNIAFRSQFTIDLANPPSLNDDLAKLFELRQHLRRFSPKLSEWFLGGKSKEQALLYSAFDESGPTASVTAVLQEKYRKDKSHIISRPLGLWNGEEDIEGATMGQLYWQGKEPSLVHFETEIADFHEYAKVLSTTKKMIEIWSPLFLSVEPDFYVPVFRDRPSVGWMLYLPRVLTALQVPEARALVT